MTPTNVFVRTMSCASLILVLVASSPVVGAAQVIKLDRPTASLPDAFSFVRGMREMPDGRLLVADYVEQRLVAVDLATGETRDVATEGPGPTEIRLPFGLNPGRADSTFAIDYGNNRLLVLAPDGRPVRTMVVEQPGRMFLRGYDATGAFVYAIPGWSEGPNALPNDSVRVVRWRPPSDEITTAVVIQGNRFRVDRSPSMEPRIPIIGFASQDAWVLSSEGEIVVVRATPYRIDHVGADGRLRIGPVQQVTTRPVTMADKRRFVTEFGASAPQSGRGPGGQMGRPPLPTAREIERGIEITEWAENHPPFDAGGVHAAPNGRVWVRRSSDPRVPALYDVFDRAGVRVQQVELPLGRSVRLVTARGVYAVAESEDGVQSIERYRLP
jgi:hypothetical protein